MSLFYRKNVASCAKHYVGDGGTTNGINENNTVIDWHGLLSIHMPGYYTSIIKGVSTIMVSYSSWNGVKMHSNYNLITGFLKNRLKFRVKNTYTIINNNDELFEMVLDNGVIFPPGICDL